MTCHPLTRAEADALWAEMEARDAERARRLPDEAACLRVMMDAFIRLKELGWREAIYCPKDGTIFDSIEAGSSGIHETHYSGEWPNGHWWVHEAGDLWPSHPILFRARNAGGNERSAVAEIVPVAEGTRLADPSTNKETGA